MAVVGLLVAVPVTIAVRGGDDGAPPAVTVAPDTEVGLGKLRFDRALGVEYRLPPGWRARRKASVLRFTKPGEGVVVAVSAPGPRRDAELIGREALASLRSTYAGVRVGQRVRGREIGGLPARGLVVFARVPGKGALRILLASARGEKRAYLVEVFVAADDQGGLVEAQALLGVLRLRG